MNMHHTLAVAPAPAPRRAATFRPNQALWARSEIIANPTAQASIDRRRREIGDVIHGRDPRMLVFVGPCSVSDPRDLREYLGRLEALSRDVSDRLVLVPRIFVEKPRTVDGWKGFAADPHLNGSNDAYHGARVSRQLLLDGAFAGLGSVSELVNPVFAPLIMDLLTSATIGARTAESQPHRQMASALPCPVGIKNGTSGNWTVAIDAMRAAARPQSHPWVCPSTGITAMCDSPGNGDTFLVLRGGSSGPNWEEFYVRAAGDELERAGIGRRRLVVDASHGNCQKRHELQRQPFLAAADQCRRGLCAGAMLESYLVAGKQALPSDLRGFKRRTLTRGQSVTDACVDWAETEALIREAHAIMGGGA
jgi:3-deoxy-7-phosphoheptulonate synthase